ncbi:MAG: hypothetical protein Q3979_06775 [Actinomycetaceae bacterium]|nr:hypothetical protein [Actinomycetaceae bacterium]
MKLLKRGIGLASVLPGAQFHERHSATIAAPVEQVWDGLMTLRWLDLRAGRPFLLARGFGPSLEQTWVQTFAPFSIFETEPPHRVLFATIGRPWTPRGGTRSAPTSLDEVRDFGEPGWLKYGMDFHLTALPGGWTFAETSTLCEATDAAARRKFRAYWSVIRPASGLIRRDILATIQRRCDGRRPA